MAGETTCETHLREILVPSATTDDVFAGVVPENPISSSRRFSFRAPL